MKTLYRLTFPLLLWTAAHAPQAAACAVCFGDPASPSTKAVKAGVLILLGITGMVLAGIGAVIITWSRRAKQLEAASQAAATLPSSSL